MSATQNRVFVFRLVNHWTLLLFFFNLQMTSSEEGTTLWLFTTLRRHFQFTSYFKNLLKITSKMFRLGNETKYHNNSDQIKDVDEGSQSWLFLALSEGNWTCVGVSLQSPEGHMWVVDSDGIHVGRYDSVSLDMNRTQNSTVGGW